MNKYHKIQSIYKRDPENKYKTFLIGEYSMPEFEYMADCIWVFTEKVDGTNIRIGRNPDGTIQFGGRTDNAQIPSVLFNHLTQTFIPLADLFVESFGDAEVCLFGEGYGGKIQKGSCYRQDQSFVLFDVMIGDMWLQRVDVEGIAIKLGIDIVPILGEGTLVHMVDMAHSGFSSTWGDFQAEGIVARPETELKTRRGDRIITKVKCKDFPDD